MTTNPKQKLVPVEPDATMMHAGTEAGAVDDDVCRRVYAAMIEASPAIPSGEQWRPIETAPKDGAWVLGGWQFHGEWVYRLVAYDARDYMQSWHQKPSDHAAPVTHWQPLPAPPGSEPIPSEPSGEQIELETTEEERARLAERARHILLTREDQPLLIDAHTAAAFFRDFAKLQARAIPSLETPEERQAKIVAALRDAAAEATDDANRKTGDEAEVHQLAAAHYLWAADAIESGDYLRTGGGE